jgi:hypothetical protein
MRRAVGVGVLVEFRNAGSNTVRRVSRATEGLLGFRVAQKRLLRLLWWRMSWN